MSRESLFVKATVLGLLAAGVVAVSVAWQIFLPGLPDSGSAALAQYNGAGQQQYLQPTQQDGSVVFTGSVNATEILTTELFPIASSEFTILSESDPPGNEPFVTVQNENGEPLETGGSGNTDTVSNADPGNYRLRIEPLGAANVEGTFTVTVTDGGAPAAQGQYETTPSPSQGQYDDGVLFEAGGPKGGPVPLMPGGFCPEEYPVERGGSCYP